MMQTATAYWHLNRHQECIARLQERLTFLRRIWPDNHPQIGLLRQCARGRPRVCSRFFATGRALSDIGGKFCSLGQRQDALMFLEQALEVLRRVLPENDPDIGGY